MTTISDVFDLPKREDIRGFVIKLRETEAGSEEVKKLVDDYVVTPAVARELPRILGDMKQFFERGEEYGRFVHGSFGSGKSHFMTMLSLLVEGSAPAWDKLRKVFEADHEGWLGKAHLLVVRIHMLSVRGKSTGFDRAVYEGFNAALKRRGKAPFEFLNVDGIFDEVRKEAADYGDVVWKRLESAGIVGSREELEALAKGAPAARERFARAWLEHKGRDPGQAGIDPKWSEGLERMAEHAKAQGFGGIVLMIDELLLWLAEKSAQEFAREINDLNTIVDHTTGQRATPVFVFAAVQRDLREFFPDLVDESKVHEHIDHHSERFKPYVKLEDVELRHIVKERVLRKKDPAAIARAVEKLGETHQKVLPALLADGTIEYLRDVYPFHPALIAMLMDVTSLMQRERSALRLLYELLVVHNPTLTLGEFLPVGSAFAAIFPSSGVEASKKVEVMQDIHHQYYSRLAPAMEQMSKDSLLDPERKKALDQIVKTVLLAEVSPRLKQGGLSIERLVQLNSADVEGETFRGRVRVAETDLLALSQKVPDLQVAGQGKTAIVRYVLGRVSLTDVLNRARSKAGSQHFNVFWPALKEALGIESLRGFEHGAVNDGDWILKWRRTERRGRLKLGNVREMTQDDFEPPADAFKVLIDYPWDEPGHSVDEDRTRAMNARKKRGTLYTMCWLPRHMSPTELGTLTELSAVRYLLSEAGQEDLLETMAPQDRAKILEQAGVRERTLQGQLEELLKEVYIHHGELFPLISDLDKRLPHPSLEQNLEHMATLLMDRRYPQHPTFLADPKRADLELLLKWMVEAGESNVSVAFDEATGRVLRNLGQPLELVNLGQTKASLRLDSRYIKDVLQRVDQDSVAWVQVADHLRSEPYGLQPLVVDLFLGFVCQRDHRALNELDGEPMDVRLGMPATARVRLQRGSLVGAPDWHRLRDLGNHLFGEPRPPAHRSLQGQDRFAAALKIHAQEKRALLSTVYQRLQALGAESGPRLNEIADARARLGPLAQTTTDSHKILSELLAAWPDDAGDPARAVVHDLGALQEALAAVSDHALGNLKLGASHPLHGVEVRDHVEALHARLGATQAERPLSKQWVDEWNHLAQTLVRKLIEQPSPPSPPAPPPPLPEPPPPPASPVLLRARVDPRNAGALSRFLDEVREALKKQGGNEVRVALVREEPE